MSFHCHSCYYYRYYYYYLWFGVCAYSIWVKMWYIAVTKKKWKFNEQSNYLVTCRLNQNHKCRRMDVFLIHAEPRVHDEFRWIMGSNKFPRYDGGYYRLSLSIRLASPPQPPSLHPSIVSKNEPKMGSVHFHSPIVFDRFKRKFMCNVWFQEC